MAELEKYIKNYPSKLMNLNSTFEKVSKTQASEKGKFDTNRFNKQIVYAEKNVGYIFILIIIIIASIFTIGYAYKNVQGMLITCTIISLAFFIVDVYKRQYKRKTTIKNTRKILLIRFGLKNISIRSVSYTHLYF